ncbi:DUF1905 domain-containing protein [Marinilongibacter aquaticus]|uniref:DUF1905 domain-containing protein n=1 Tax=Marinilongibacter aquaticus TaxID=2975157 RepID=UPI0021BD0185|nr:DUF1905 domain-containing protein [Marinilongibacter aquaticus]UBM59633.1 DUF1905 domain-containing protein [Marinilongibacter aquaticus]
MQGIPYRFTASVWKYTGESAWHFVSLPASLANEIRNLYKSEEAAWGRLKVTAKIGQNKWKTAIWYDSQKETYLLPLKAEIRKREKIINGQSLYINIWV